MTATRRSRASRPAGDQPRLLQNGSAGLNTSVFVTGGTHYYGEDRKSYRVSGLLAPVDSFTWNVSFENYVDTGGPVSR